ncbi:AAA family ATPase [Nonomuraea ceibae]|uniref:AAA family ATPase n=1 Tax=Nonomuraea ceibae TaxID=1935170 RepID=UPI001C5F4A04|nr:AAA family ATPase [Nonomuraea ceibae]
MPDTQTKLIVIRGNSGSGKTTLAKAVREAYGRRGLAIISQDIVRREMLREPDVPGGVNIGLLKTICLHALAHDHHVVLEGILTGSRYGAMLDRLRREHQGPAVFFYLDVPWEETLRRHETRPQRSQFTPEQMAEWFADGDLLPGGHEHLLDHTLSVEDATRRILNVAGLTGHRPAPLRSATLSCHRPGPHPAPCHNRQE